MRKLATKKTALGLASGILAVSSLFSVPSFASTPKTVHSINSTSHRYHQIKRVLMISVDGMHAKDLANYVKNHPHSNMAALSHRGITYTNASTSKPSDSFPGTLSEVTGGSPNSTGVFYDDSYDRKLLPPKAWNQGDKPGTNVLYDETIDKDLNKLNGGGGINPDMLPRDPVTKKPVYPHNYVRVNTIFEVIKQAGMHTAWADKHLAYDLLNGPSGKGIEDLYTPEIAANGDATRSIATTEVNDDLKVKAILNEIDGKDHSGKKAAPVPGMFGMNFQEVSVAQKLPGNGYKDGKGTPSAGLAEAFKHTDESLGKIVNELKKKNLYDSTMIVLTAKHGQAPMDPAKVKITDKNLITDGVPSNLIAHMTTDDIGMIWLTDQSKTAEVVAQINKNKKKANISEVTSYVTTPSKWLFNNPAKDSRVPDIVIRPNDGVIYAKPGKKIAEHGGFSKDDTNVALLVSIPGLEKGMTDNYAVQTTQVAPTILEALGLNPNKLQAVQKEHTKVLPGIDKELDGKKEKHE
ncbi:alkaline phosphatase family protein [Heyndrickxia acidicola]|uniref:Alkaline phosphatase family protein n=1 Tax=Heyndrickxia acidicola TaxID=209389 RepID=A0ABU6MMQ2_9BACI|nr:alkaline phosphatase family protein [Heyndrickxia acidicola]MED1205779.1 alkaline phosphatase family protein [Heyndrickxia acidicola]